MARHKGFIGGCVGQENNTGGFLCKGCLYQLVSELMRNILLQQLPEISKEVVIVIRIGGGKMKGNFEA